MSSTEPAFSGMQSQLIIYVVLAQVRLCRSMRVSDVDKWSFGPMLPFPNLAKRTSERWTMSIASGACTVIFGRFTNSVRYSMRSSPYRGGASRVHPLRRQPSDLYPKHCSVQPSPQDRLLRNPGEETRWFTYASPSPGHTSRRRSLAQGKSTRGVMSARGTRARFIPREPPLWWIVPLPKNSLEGPPRGSVDTRLSVPRRSYHDSGGEENSLLERSSHSHSGG